MKVVVVGGAAAGPKAASRIARLCPDAEIVLFEKGKYLSYAACGLPYLIGKEVANPGMLMTTLSGTLRNPNYFQKVKNVTTRIRSEVISIDTTAKTIEYRDLKVERTAVESYDKLVLTTGAHPIRPHIPGVDLKSVNCLHTMEDPKSISASIKSPEDKCVVIVGGGLIGVETAEALVARGCQVTLVEMLPQILQMLDPEMALQVERHMTEKGVNVLTSTRVEEIAPSENDETKVGAVKTSEGELPADMVLLAVGVKPNIDLARMAGIEIGELGGIVTDEKMLTSAPDVYAAGDCVETHNLLTDKPCLIPLGSTANKQGRVVANSICGVDDTFPGVLGSSICKVFDVTAGRTGLSEHDARHLGSDVVTAIVPGPDRPHFMPDFKLLALKLIADRKTGQLIGAQAVGAGGADKRLDVAATAIASGMTVDRLAQLDLLYAPPYSPAMDNIITAANVLRNKINGEMVGVSAKEVKTQIDSGADPVLLDARSAKEFAGGSLPGAINIPLDALRTRCGELPRDRDIVCLCKIALRGYEAARILTNAGFDNVKTLDGGIMMWPYESGSH